MYAAIATVYRDIRGWLDDAWPLLLLIGTIVVMALIGANLDRQSAAEHAEQIALCMRAFEYTRDQCEFIVRSGVMVKP